MDSTRADGFSGFWSTYGAVRKMFVNDGDGTFTEDISAAFVVGGYPAIKIFGGDIDMDGDVCRADQIPILQAADASTAACGDDSCDSVGSVQIDLFVFSVGTTQRFSFTHCPTSAYSRELGCVVCPTFSKRLPDVDQCRECPETYELNAQGRH